MVKSPILVTTTMYKSVDEVRCQLAFETVRKAVADGYTIVVVDGSPTTDVHAELRGLGAIVFPELHRGMGPSRRQAFFHAVEVAGENCVDGILWLEAEKHDLIRSLLQIQDYFCEDADILVIGRESSAWETYPPFQVETEQQANAEWSKVTGLKGFDPFFGPVAFSVQTAAKYFVLNQPKLSCLEDTYVGHYATLLGLNAGLKVWPVSVDFVYPPAQRAEELGALNDEMIKKRRWQMETLVKAYHTLMRSKAVL